MMLRREKSKGQSIAEYAIVATFVIGAIAGMQLYLNRGLKGKLVAVSDNVGAQLAPHATIAGGQNYKQYEPYYTSVNNYKVTQDRASNYNVSAGFRTNRTNIEETTTRSGDESRGATQGDGLLHQ